MKLSIIVPVYNMMADNKLDYCLQSLVNQTIDDYEIIAVNDASTDNSLQLLKQYQTQFPEKIKVISLQENHKQGGAKNAGLDVCTGDFVGFVDSDDWILPDMYETLVNLALEQEADIAACTLCHVYTHTMTPTEGISSLKEEYIGDITHDKFRKLISNSGAIVTKVFRRRIFEEPKLRFPEHMFYEDNAIGTELIHRASKIAFIDKPMYFYYQDANSTTHALSESKCYDRMEAMRIMIRLAKEGAYFDEYYTEFEYKFMNLFYQNTLFSYLRGTRHVKMGFIRKLGKEMHDTFPNFQNNPIYQAVLNDEEKRMMALQQKSTLVFLIYYKLLWFVRDLKSKIKKLL